MTSIGNWPLWLKYTLLMALLTTLISLIAGEAVRLHESPYLEGKLEQQMQKTFAALSAATMEDVITEDVPHLESMLKQLIQHYPDICYVEISNEKGVKLAQWGVADATKDKIKKFHYRISHEGEIFGEIRISIGLESLLQQLEYHVNQSRLYSAVALFTLGLVFYFISQQLFISPINKISKKLMRLTKASGAKKLKLSSRGELKQLNESVDLLVLTIKQKCAKEVLLKKAMQDARQASKVKTEFIATMSHEIRTPMNAILGTMDILKGEQLTPKQLQYVDTSENAAKLLLGQLNSILDYSKLESGKLALEIQPFSPSRLLSSITNMFMETAKQKKVELTIINKLANNIDMLGDASRLSQVLTNLIANAVKFTPKGQITVKLSACSHADEWLCVFQVEDTGIGIDEAKLDAICSAFTQQDPSFSRRYGGVGLGLSIAKHLLELMGSELKLSSKLGIGSCFSFELHLKQAPQVARQEKTMPQSMQHVDKPVLLVEDSPANQLVAKTILQRAGLKVVTADNGLEAIRLVKEKAFSVILMDLQMPKMNGLDASKSIRKHHNKTPIIAMTANVSPRDKALSFSAGMDDFLAKPVDKKQMLSLINQWASP